MVNALQTTVSLIWLIIPLFVLRNVSDCKVMFRSLLYGMC